MILRTLVVCSVVMALCGCGPKEGSPSGPTYYQDVAPILSKNCSGCHVEGGAAPFALSNAQQAQTYAAAMRTAVQNHVMPPWPPGPATPELMHERKLTDDEISTLSTWAENGAPLGDAKKPAALPQPDEVKLATVDADLDIGVDYEPDTTLRDDYRCFLLDVNNDAEKMAMAFNVIPGNKRIVHHVILYVFDGSSKDDLMALDAQSSRPGWTCFGGPADHDPANPTGILGGWVPGQTAQKFSPGTAKALPAHALLVAQVHYNLAGGHDPDRTRVQLQYAVPAQAKTLQASYTVPTANENLLIPANGSHVTVEELDKFTDLTSGFFFPDGTAYITSVAGHMHKLGTAISLSLINETGEHTLLDIPHWDFHWQGNYQLKTPVLIHATDQIRMRCTYDNTVDKRAEGQFVTPMRDVTWGEGTEDEMCLGYAEVADSVPGRL